MAMKYAILLMPMIAIADVPNVFEPGEVAEAHEVNENFDVLDSRIEQLKADVAAAQTPTVSTECPCADQYITAMQLYIGLGGTLHEGQCWDSSEPETESRYISGNLQLRLHAEIAYTDTTDMYSCTAELTEPAQLFYERTRVFQEENHNPWIASCQALVESYCVLP